MRAILQRVRHAKVSVGDETVGEIGKGWLVLVGITHLDTSRDARYLADKILNLRAFEDDAGKMNLSVLDLKGDVLVVSQFTLYADCRKGRRPSFVDAAPPGVARPLYEALVDNLKHSGLKIATGRFQAEMQVNLVNDGPVTLIIESPQEDR